MTHRIAFPLRPLEAYRPSETSPLLVLVSPHKCEIVWPERDPMGHLPDSRPWVECFSPEGTLLFTMRQWEVAALLEQMALHPERSEPCTGGTE